MLAPLASSAQAPPARALVDAVFDTLHGVVVHDPFRHLEDASDSVTRAWVRSQDQYARNVIERAPLFHTVADEVRRIANATVYAPPREVGRWEFFSTFSASGPGAAIAVHVRPRGTLTGARLLADAKHTGPRFGGSPLMYSPSPDGRLVVIGISSPESGRMSLRVVETATGIWRHDEVTSVYRALARISWHPSSNGFYYTRSRAGSTPGPGAVFWHALGSSADSPVFSVPADSQVAVSHAIATSGSTLVVSITNNSTRSTSMLFQRLDKQGGGLEPVSLPAGSYTLAGEYKGELFFQTNADAPLGKVIAVRIDRPTSVRSVVPEADAPISTWGGTGATIVGGKILVAYVRNSEFEVWTVSLGDGTRRRIQLPAMGSVWSGFVGTPASQDVYFQLQGLADPGTIYRLSLESGRSTVHMRPTLAYDPTTFVTTRTEYASSDGTRVPIHIVRRPDVTLDGSAPLIMYGYGFGGWIAAPWFQPAMAAWVARGGIWAVAGVRGGGEHGRGWWDAGSRHNKQVGINDYIAAAEWLVANRYTSHDRFVANSSSAGGPLVAAATLQRPELFRAAIHDYSIFDMLRYDRFGHGSTWQSEYGTAANLRDFSVLQTYSPYHNVGVGSCPPSTLLTPGELDQTAPAFHSFKFLAALSHFASPSCSSTHLLRVSWGAGHSAGASPSDAAETWAAELSFLSNVLGRAFPAAGKP